MSNEIMNSKQIEQRFLVSFWVMWIFFSFQCIVLVCYRIIIVNVHSKPQQ